MDRYILSLLQFQWVTLQPVQKTALPPRTPRGQKRRSRKNFQMLLHRELVLRNKMEQVLYKTKGPSHLLNLKKKTLHNKPQNTSSSASNKLTKNIGSSPSPSAVSATLSKKRKPSLTIASSKTNANITHTRLKESKQKKQKNSSWRD